MTRAGAAWRGDVARFAVRAPRADRVWLCLFDGDAERRVEMSPSSGAHGPAARHRAGATLRNA